MHIMADRACFTGWHSSSASSSLPAEGLRRSAAQRPARMHPLPACAGAWRPGHAQRHAAQPPCSAAQQSHQAVGGSRWSTPHQ